MTKELALSKIAELDVAGLWDEVLAKDLPGDLVTYVAERLSEVPLDTIRRELGIRSSTDVRWRKLMTAIKGGIRIDGTGIFLKWLRRTEMLADKVGHLVDRQLAGEVGLTKMTLMSLDTMSNMQMNTIKMGKELGVFMDATQAAMTQGQGNQQVTIVVQTNVPTPDLKTIVVHQEEQKRKNDKLLAAYEAGRDEAKEEPK